MKIAVVGPSYKNENVNEFYNAQGEEIVDHSVCSMTLGLTKALRKHGFDAYIWKGEKIDADAAFICEYNYNDHIMKNNLWDYTKPTIVWLHFDFPSKIIDGHKLKSMTSGLAFTRQEALDSFKKKWGDGNYFIIPWAFPEWWKTPPEKPNPYKSNTKNIVYAGRIEKNGNIIKFVKYVADNLPNVNIHIISNCKDLEIINHLKSSKNINYIGSMPHGTFLNYLYYADLALDTGIFDNRMANNCKIWDYLAMGVPIVTDGKCGGDELIYATKNGSIVNRLDFSKYLLAINEILNGKEFPRSQAIEYMQKNWTWEKTSDLWINWAEKIYKQLI